MAAETAMLPCLPPPPARSIVLMRISRLARARRLDLNSTTNCRQRSCDSALRHATNFDARFEPNRRSCRSSAKDWCQTRKSPPPGSTGGFLSRQVGATGFEPATSASRTQRSTRLSHAPMVFCRSLSGDVSGFGWPTEDVLSALSAFPLATWGCDRSVRCPDVGLVPPSPGFVGNSPW